MCFFRLLVNALYLELPIFFLETPEGFMIASSISLAVQCANIFLLLYLLVRRVVPTLRLVPVIMGTITVSILCCFVAGGFWEVTAMIAGSETSVIILLVSFLGGGVGCVSNATYWPLVSSYHPTLLMALSVGMGLSGIIPSIVVAIQDAGENPRFSVLAYCGVMAVIFLVSLVSLGLITRLGAVQRYHRESHLKRARQRWSTWLTVESNGDDDILTRPVRQDDDGPAEIAAGGQGGDGDSRGGAAVSEAEQERRPLLSALPSLRERRDHQQPEAQNDSEEDDAARRPPLPRRQSSRGHKSPEEWQAAFRGSVTFFATMSWISVAYFFLPGAATYLVAGFPNSAEVLLWYNIVGMVGGTLGRFSSIMFRRMSLILSTALLTVLFALIFVFGSPGGHSAAALVVVHLFFAATFGATNTLLYKLTSIRHDVETSETLCKWLGVCEQVGAFVGSLSCFLLVYFGVMHG